MTSTTNSPTIDVQGVSKWYGDVVAVNDVSFEVHPGITGLLGPNGAGKSTLLHVIVGLARPSEGAAQVLGSSARDDHSIYREIGYMSEHENVYEFQTGRRYIETAARLYGMEQVGAASERAIKAVGMSDAQDRPLDTYSRGMRQRMRLAAALVHDPEVLILDEPLNGTDPRQRVEFHDLMRRIGAEGRTVLISSHILEEVETLANTILLMVSAKLAAAGDFRAIRAKLDEQPYTVRIDSDSPRALASALVALDAVDSVSVDRDDTLIVLSRDIAHLQRALPVLAKEKGIRLRRLEPLDDSLESVFSYVVER